MRRFSSFWVILAALSAAVPTWSTAAAVPSISTPTDQKRASEAGEATNGGDCPTSLRLLAPAMTKPQAIPEDGRSAAFDLAVSCSVDAHKNDLAHSYALIGTGFSDASDWLWKARLALELDGESNDAALTTVVAMTRGRGAALNGIPVEWLYRLDNAFRGSGDATARRRLLGILTDPSYQPDEPVPLVDGFRMRYAELLLEDGKRDAALAMARQIDTPSLVMRLSVDPRLRSSVPEGWDARVAMTAYFERLKAAAIGHSDSLALVIEIARIERRLGRPAEALAILEANDPNAPGGPTYRDRDAQLAWWWDALGHGYEAVGDFEHAIDAMRHGASVEENGGGNVSQTINLAEMQIRIGRPGEALTTLSALDRPGASISPYGEMEMRFTRGCATKMVGRSDAGADVTYAKAHPRDNPEAFGDLLLCTGDMDGAAAAFISRLQGPKTAADALLELSEYASPPASLPPHPVYSRLPGLTARPDVRAAVQAVGGTRQFDVER